MTESESTQDGGLSDNKSSDPPFVVERRSKTKKKSPKRRVSDSQWDRYIDRFRDVGFLVLGLASAAHQLFWASPPNPVLYPIIAALLGAPIAFALDDRRKDNRDEQEKE